MGQTTFSGPVRIGNPVASTSQGLNADVGYVVCSQTQNAVFAATAVVDVTFTLPAQSQLIDVLVDIETVWNAAGAVTGSLGVSTGATTYASGVDMKTASGGRVRPTFTAAQLASMDDVSTNTSAVFSITTASGTNTTGAARITLVYVAARDAG